MNDPAETQVIAFVLPCYNEEAALRRAVDEIVSIAVPLGVSRTIYLIDDGSIDSTWDEICFLANSTQFQCIGLRLGVNLGKSQAQAIGVREAAASADIVILMDADGQHDPAALEKAIPFVLASGTTLLGRRTGHRRSLMSRLGTVILTMLSKLLGIPYDEDVSEYVIMTGQTARRLTAIPSFGVAPLVPLVIQASQRCDYFTFAVQERIAQAAIERWTLDSYTRKGLMHLLVDPWKLLTRLALLLAIGALLLGFYGLAIGISSVASGQFLGIGSLMVAFVLVFAVLAALLISVLGLTVLGLGTPTLAESSIVAERVGRNRE